MSNLPFVFLVTYQLVDDYNYYFIPDYRCSKDKLSEIFFHTIKPFWERVTQVCNLKFNNNVLVIFLYVAIVSLHFSNCVIE